LYIILLDFNLSLKTITHFFKRQGKIQPRVENFQTIYIIQEL